MAFLDSVLLQVIPLCGEKFLLQLFRLRIFPRKMSWEAPGLRNVAIMVCEWFNSLTCIVR